MIATPSAVLSTTLLQAKWEAWCWRVAALQHSPRRRRLRPSMLDSRGHVLVYDVPVHRGAGSDVTCKLCRNSSFLTWARVDGLAEAKVLHGLRRFQLRGLHKVNMEGPMVAAGQNLKRLLRHWGARKWPAPSSLSLFLKSLSIGPTLRPDPVHPPPLGGQSSHRLELAGPGLRERGVPRAWPNQLSASTPQIRMGFRHPTRL